jgi:methyl-accepting chemotaxis protein/DNA-binding LacI/PurR family transcriptional regulator
MGNTTRLAEGRRKDRAESRPTVGLLVLGVAGEFGAPFWAGAADAATELDLNVICFAGGMLRSPQGFDAQANVAYDLVNSSRVDGLVVWTGILGHYVGSAEMRFFCDQFRPLPLVSIELPIPGYPSLLADFSQGMQDVIAHLVEAHGHKRIAFISGPNESGPAQQRYQAYELALKDHGLRVDPSLVVPGTFFAPSGAEAVKELLDKRKVEFDALGAANDNMAIDAMRALQARGIRIPDDVAIVGIDDIEESRSITPTLTTAKLPQREWGRRGVELLHALWKGQSIPHQQLQPMQVIVRQSCGCLLPEVIQAVAPHVPWRRRILNRARFPGAGLAACREVTLVEMTQTLGTLPAARALEEAERIWRAFSDEIIGKKRGRFIAAVALALQHMAEAGGDVSDWQSALSALRNRSLPCLAGCGQALADAENLWQQARVLIAQAALQAQVEEQFQYGTQNDLIQNIGDALNNAFDMEALTQIVIRQLPRLGIRSCYLCVYADPRNPTGECRLVIAYRGSEKLDLAPEERRFPSWQLVPDRVLTGDSALNLLVQPVYYQKEQLGFVVFEIGTRNGKVYEAISRQLSSGLKGSLLFQDRNRLMNRLLENAQHVNTASCDLAHMANQAETATGQLANTITQVAKGTQQQAASATRLSALVEQMVMLIRHVAAGAQEGEQRVAEASQIAQSGSDFVTSSLQRIENIRAKVKLSADRVNEMGEASTQIKKIILAIEDIASRTNLLALNASIEAARAGEQGRGFAVVASEVRCLAEKSALETKEISLLVNTMRRTVADAVSAMGDSVEEVEKGAALTGQSRLALAEILKAVTVVKGQVAEIAAAAKSMSDGATEMMESVESIASISEENGAAAEEVSAAAQQMNAQSKVVAISAQRLKEMADTLQA